MARIILTPDLHAEVHHADGHITDLGTADYRGIAERTGVSEERARSAMARTVERWLFTEQMNTLDDIVITPEGVFQAFPWTNDDGDWVRRPQTFEQPGATA